MARSFYIVHQGQDIDPSEAIDWVVLHNGRHNADALGVLLEEIIAEEVTEGDAQLQFENLTDGTELSLVIL